MDIENIRDNEEKAKWYPLEGTTVKIKVRRPSPRKRDSLARQCKKGRFNARMDEDKLARLLLDYSVVDWSGITEGGAALPCTTDNKVKLDGIWSEFRDLWFGVVQGELESDEEELEDSRGN